MEVHHHAHSDTHRGRRKWTHHLWEFLMLFLAVFCGFLAEYQLEHKIEKDRAKELARSLYEELREDSASMSARVQNRLRQESSLKWLMGYFKDSNLTQVSKTFSIHFLYGIYFRTPSLFEARTVVLDQLKNSGSLRYFKNQKLQQLIGELSVAIAHINDRQELETQVRSQWINPFIVSHYDYGFNEMITRDGKLLFNEAVRIYEESNDIFPFHLRGADRLNRENTVNTLGIFGISALRATRQQHFQRYINLNLELLKALREEYHLR
jgi:hypothetical protein